MPDTVATVETATTKPIIDGESHPLTADLVPAMVALLTAMFAGNDVNVFDYYRSRALRPIGWRLACGTIKVESSNGQISIVGQDFTINSESDGETFSDEFDATRALTTYTIVPGRRVTLTRTETESASVFVIVQPPSPEPVA